MWVSFVLQHLHFAGMVFTALMVFAAGWLYTDAAKSKRTASVLLTAWSYYVLSLSFLIEAAHIETTTVGLFRFSDAIVMAVYPVVRLIGYLLLAIGVSTEPILPVPDKRKMSYVVAPVFLSTVLVPALVPVAAALVGVLYMYRAAIGREDHVKTPALVFFGFSVAELFGMASLFRDTTHVGLYTLVAPFGVLWICSVVITAVCAALLGKWVFGYLLKQFVPQLFFVFMASMLTIFVLTTVTFTGLMLRSVETETLHQLSIDAAVLSYTVDGKRNQIISDAELLAANPSLLDAVANRSSQAIVPFLETSMMKKRLTTVVCTDEHGVVLARGEESDRRGDSISSNPLVERALSGQTVSSITARDGVVAPSLSVSAAVPVIVGNRVIGTILVGSAIDASFVDGMKRSTGLESSVYADAKVAATTVTGVRSSVRLVGLELSDASIRRTVLSQGKPYAGAVTLASVPYYGAFVPVFAVDETAAGMLFVGKPQTTVLDAAATSIQETMIVVLVCMVLSLGPAYLIARSIGSQVG